VGPQHVVRPLASAVRESVVSSVLGLSAGGLFLAVVALGNRPVHDVLRLLAIAVLWCVLFGTVIYVFVRRGLRRLIASPTPVREPDSVTLWRCCLQDGIWIAMLVVLTLAWGNAAFSGGLALGNGLLSVLMTYRWRHFERRNQVLLLREPRIGWGSNAQLFAAPNSVI
jgi:uncharacterized protein involved in response to NO